MGHETSVRTLKALSLRKLSTKISHEFGGEVPNSSVSIFRCNVFDPNVNSIVQED